MKTNKRTKLDHTEKKSARFFDLPGEIRNRIYELALLPPEGTHIALRNQFKVDHLSVTKELLKDNKTNRACSIRVRRRAEAANRYAMLIASRATHREAVTILYAQPLHFKSQSALVNFLAEIGYPNRSLLRDVSIITWSLNTDMSKAVFTLLADSAKTLKRLHIEGRICYGGANDNPETIARKVAESIFQTAFPLLEAIGRARGAKDAALNVIELGPNAWDMKVSGSSSWQVVKALGGEERQALERLYKQELGTLLRRGR